MKQIFKVLGVALVASCMIFVSCDKEENNNQNQNPQDENPVNLTGFNIAESYGFTITLCYCGEFTGEENSFLMQGIADGTLYADWYYPSGAEDNYYIGARLNFVSGSTGGASFNVGKYEVETQNLRLYSRDNQNDYTGTVVLTQDKDKVYMSWTGEPRFPDMFETARIEGYVLKSKL